MILKETEVGAPSQPEVTEVVKVALDDFWSRVAKSFPHAKTGDLSPEMTIKLEAVCNEAVTEWWNNNCKDVI